MEKRALITGITGQIGSYLAEYLLEKGYKIYGLIRRTSTPNTENIKSILKDIELVEGDLTDSSSLIRIIRTIKPHEVYNLGAQSHVHISFDQPITTADITGLGVVKMLEAIRESNFHSKFLQCSTSEMFGKVLETPQRESTPFYPRSPYGVAKLYGYWITRNYQESYNMFACNAILFNTESPRRGMNFVTRKITDGIGKIVNKKADNIELGNLDAKRDWSYATDIVDGIYRIMNHSEPDTFVLASGQSHSVEEFIDLAFKAAGITDWKPYIKTNPKWIRPAEVDTLMGDSTKARTILGWKPKSTFQELVTDMVNADIARNK
jgi:GDPmannose 4,6-dehydratase